MKDSDLELDEELENALLIEILKEKIEQEENNVNHKKKKVKKQKNKYTVTYLKSGLKVKTVVMLLVTLIVNTYAWFIYVSKVSSTLSMHVRDWKFELSDGDQTQDFEFFLDEVYPGVKTEDTVNEITATNSSNDTTAILTCDLKYVKIFYNEYESGQTYENEDGTEITYDSEKLFNKINNDYPFKIQVLIVSGAEGAEVVELYDPTREYEMLPQTSVKIRIQVVWPYESAESGDALVEADKLDTYWGNESYKFSTDPAKEDEYSIVLRMDIKADQKEGRP